MLAGQISALHGHMFYIPDLTTSHNAVLTEGKKALTGFNGVTTLNARMEVHFNLLPRGLVLPSSDSYLLFALFFLIKAEFSKQNI